MFAKPTENARDNLLVHTRGQLAVHFHENFADSVDTSLGQRFRDHCSFNRRLPAHANRVRAQDVAFLPFFETALELAGLENHQVAPVRERVEEEQDDGESDSGPVHEHAEALNVRHVVVFDFRLQAFEHHTLVLSVGVVVKQTFAALVN